MDLIWKSLSVDAGSHLLTTLGTAVLSAKPHISRTLSLVHGRDNSVSVLADVSPEGRQL
jgi:hypothetical protein